MPGEDNFKYDFVAQDLGGGGGLFSIERVEWYGMLTLCQKKDKYINKIYIGVNNSML